MSVHDGDDDGNGGHGLDDGHGSVPQVEHLNSADTNTTDNHIKIDDFAIPECDEVGQPVGVDEVGHGRLPECEETKPEMIMPNIINEMLDRVVDGGDDGNIVVVVKCKKKLHFEV